MLNDNHNDSNISKLTSDESNPSDNTLVRPSIFIQLGAKSIYFTLICAGISLLMGVMLLFSVLDEQLDLDYQSDFGVMSVAHTVTAYLRGDTDAVQSLVWLANYKNLLNQEHTLNKQQLALVSFLNKKYRTAPSELRKIIAYVYYAASQTKLDPLLILAVASVESNFNPIIESPVGAQGIMQVMPKVHAARFVPYGGVENIFRMDANINVGARILQDCIRIAQGSIEKGLQCYVGATDAPEPTYAIKVLGERDRLVRAQTGDFDFSSNAKNSLDLTPAVELSPSNATVHSEPEK